VVFRGVFQHTKNGFWEARICWGLEGEFRRGFCHGANGANSDDSPAGNLSMRAWRAFGR
jgi:hypothetical protein